MKAPLFSFVTEKTDALSPVFSDGFSAVQSLAYGGLANAWGAGTFEFTAEDLAPFPFGLAELRGHYQELVKEIGISGTSDDLASHFGSTEGLQPPHPLDRLSSRLLAGYERRRVSFQEHGFRIGRPRLAVLSRDLGERRACNYDNLTFWEPQVPYLYTPRFTLDRLIRDGRISYQPGRLVKTFCETPNGVDVHTLKLDSETRETFSGARLILAAGCLNSARIVLASADDSMTRLPLLDNQVSMVPFVTPAMVGDRLDFTSHGVGQLVAVYRGPSSESYVQATYYTYGSLLASEVIMDFPFTIRGSTAACKYILPAFSLFTCFYPEAARPGNTVRLLPSGSLELIYKDRVSTGAVEHQLIGLMRRLGFWSHTSLVKTPTPGNGVHYGGTLPMVRSEGGGAYTTSPTGRLSGTRFVYVADAAVFPCLPAKNHTLTIMANAMRTAGHVASSLTLS